MEIKNFPSRAAEAVVNVLPDHLGQKALLGAALFTGTAELASGHADSLPLPRAIVAGMVEGPFGAEPALADGECTYDPNTEKTVCDGDQTTTPIETGPAPTPEPSTTPDPTETYPSNPGDPNDPTSPEATPVPTPYTPEAAPNDDDTTSSTEVSTSSSSDNDFAPIDDAKPAHDGVTYAGPNKHPLKPNVAHHKMTKRKQLKNKLKAAKHKLHDLKAHHGSKKKIAAVKHRINVLKHKLSGKKSGGHKKTNVGRKHI